jgi:hypothetical protein
MTVTVDGKTLRVYAGEISESTDPVGSFTDQWINETYSKKATIYGSVKTWTLECFEKNVAWAGCNAKHLRDKADVGDVVVLVIDEGDMHQVAATNVYILGCKISYREGATKTSFCRDFSLTLQEAPS